ncbi:hypothetical protein ACFQFC_08490 [Amorphoplanes digitatis]|uniref:Uncharacterized protein n=1 Tax=Actinoplanes digitatis TaxID=1868 RepID=A0A7W7MRH5_9ACTN|nr:hypothetical protein [Actinoplanes digitatis]MBB4764243.1 hypothetical protein [Actinoplanes digitatis]
MEIMAASVLAVSLPAELYGPLLPGPAERRLVTVRTDDALAVYDLDRLAAGDGAPAVTFPAPWPRLASGVDVVAPGLDLAVFTGLHAVRAVAPDGATRWEIGHACWACEDFHESAEEYAGDGEHRHPDSGSAGFDADGRAVWVHVRAPLACDEDEDAGDDPRGESGVEAWLVIDAADGEVLARADPGTYAAGSEHIPHPGPGVMGLSVGEGQDGAPALWGHRQGDHLRIDRLDGDDRILLAAGPGGHTFLTIGHERREELAVHRSSDHAVLGTVSAGDLAPAAPSAGWDYGCGVVDDRTLIAGTSDDADGVVARHWLIDVETLEVRALRYPIGAGSNPFGLGDGTWVTSGPGPGDVHVWRLPEVLE